VIVLLFLQSNEMDLQLNRADLAAYAWQSISNSSRNRTTIFGDAPASNATRTDPAMAEYSISATNSMSPNVALVASANAAVSRSMYAF
jgi:hypothetical protein